MQQIINVFVQMEPTKIVTSVLIVQKAAKHVWLLITALLAKTDMCSKIMYAFKKKRISTTYFKF